MKKALYRSSFSALSLAAFLASHSAIAASSTWLASPVTAKWNNASNWSALPQSGDSLIFGTSSQTVLANDLTNAAFVVGGIMVNAGAPAFTISGNPFTLGTSTSGTVVTNNSSNDLTIYDDITLGNALQTIAATGGKISLAGAISGAGANSGLAVTGWRQVILSGSNSYTGVTSLNGNMNFTLNYSAATATGVISGSSALVMGGASTLILNGAANTAVSQTFNGLTLNPGASRITMNGGGGTATLTLNLGEITHNTGGTLNFSIIPTTSGTVATTANTNTNGILGAWASAGNGSPGATGANMAISLHYATVNENGQIVSYTGGTQISGGASLITETTGTGNYDVVITSNTAINTSAVSVNTIRNASLASYTTTLGGTLTTNGLMNDATGSWTISGSTIKSGATKELVIQASSAGQSVAINSIIADSDSGASALTYSGIGALSLMGANTYSGSTYINGAPVSITAANGLGNSQNIYFASGSLNTSNTFDLGSSRSLAFSGASGGITASSGTLTVSGAVSTTGTLTIAGTGGVTISGAISGEGGLVKNSASLLTLTGNNTYTGATTITTGTLQLGNGTSGKDGSIASGSIVNNSSLVFNRYGNSSYGGAISGSGVVTKTGAGKQTLSGLSSYTGATAINAGTLEVTGTLGSTASLTAAAGTVLSIDGRINTAAAITSAGTVQGQGAVGALGINANGVLAAGQSLGNSNLGTLSATDVTFGSNATFSIRLGAGGECDQLLLAGMLTLNNTLLALDLSGVTFTGADIGTDFVIVNGGASLTGAGSNLFSQGSSYDAGNGITFAINYGTTADGTGSGSDVVLTLQAVPEPATWALAVGGMGILVCGQRLRRRMLF